MYYKMRTYSYYIDYFIEWCVYCGAVVRQQKLILPASLEAQKVMDKPIVPIEVATVTPPLLAIPS